MSQISNKLPKKSYFWLLLLAAIIIHQIPIISVPFKWLESYFHEISHGLAAVATGGRIVRIELLPTVPACALPLAECVLWSHLWATQVQRYGACCYTPWAVVAKK